MEDLELEALRQKRLAEMQTSQQQIEDQRRQVEAQKQNILRQILTPEARDRLANIRVANLELASSVEMQLIHLAQSGRIQGVIDDTMLKDILKNLAPARREITIERR